MASGFIILNDGRCLAPNWYYYDCIIDLVVQELQSISEKDKLEFKNWLQTQIPSEGDIDNGYGGFIKKDDGTNIQRWLDLRELTINNQVIFWNSLQKVLSKLITGKVEIKERVKMISLIQRMLKMKKMVDKGDHPDNLSDWKQGYTSPRSEKRSGPGWR